MINPKEFFELSKQLMSILDKDVSFTQENKNTISGKMSFWIYVNYKDAPIHTFIHGSEIGVYNDFMRAVIGKGIAFMIAHPCPI